MRQYCRQVVPFGNNQVIFSLPSRKTQAPSEKFKRSNHADGSTISEMVFIALSENLVKKRGVGYKIEWHCIRFTFLALFKLNLIVAINLCYEEVWERLQYWEFLPNQTELLYIKPFCFTSKSWIWLQMVFRWDSLGLPHHTHVTYTRFRVSSYCTHVRVKD